MSDGPVKLRFAANLSFLFQDIACLPERYIAAKRAGFSGVECADPYSVAINVLVEAKENAKVEQVLLNSFKGDTSGLAAVPNRQDEFQQCLELSIQYCTALKCKRLHIPSGVYPEGDNEEKESLWRETFIQNLRYASQRVALDNITILIEPISNIHNYFLSQTDQAIEIIKELNCDNVKLLLDLYHHQRTHGDITNTLSNYLPYIGHIQISQVPDRNEPDSNGEINYTFVFNHLLRIGYSGWIGCEYVPQDSKGLGWIEPYLQRDDDMELRVIKS
ncbi:putative hydroxypyruvate isomerase [Rhopilema esculentum]|uniref:putative hydroxypyruvate isomerase n=1 Tax=Rhopilema esculentum TaxID=499914 RepID=UPI0031DAA246